MTDSIRLRLPYALAERFGTRGAPLVVHMRDYAELMDRSFPAGLSHAEVQLIADALNWALLTVADCHLLWSAVAETEASGLPEKWGVEFAPLVARLRKLQPAGCWALYERVQRWWRDPTEDRWAELGLP